MNLNQKIENLTLKQLLIIAAVLAFLIILWQNKELIKAKIEQASEK